MLLCGFDPTEPAIGLRCLAQFSDTDDRVAVVTTKRVSRKQSTHTRRSLKPRTIPQSALSIWCPRDRRYRPLMVRSRRYSRGDIERLVLALSELTEQTDRGKDQHLLVRSLSPMINSAEPDQVADVLDRISGFRTAEGVALFSLDYTAHDKSTVTTIHSKCRLDGPYTQLCHRYC